MIVVFEDDGSSPGNDYEMELLLESAVPNCAAGDFFEPNDSPLAAFPVIEGTASGLSACPGNEDYFAINVNSGDEINVDISFSDAEGDIDLRLYSPTGSLAAWSISSTDDESLSHTVGLGGWWLIRVNLWSDAGPAVGNSYDIELELD